MGILNTAPQDNDGGKVMADKVLKTNRKLEKLLNDLINSDDEVYIGILSESFNDSKQFYDEDGLISSEEETLGEIAYIHEFGKGRIPERSFLRSTWDKEKNDIDLTVQALAKRQIKKDNYKVETLLDSVGVFMVGKVKETFRNNNWPPLADPTRGGRNKDGLSTPLIDTGQLINSIDYKIIKDKSK